MNGIVDPVGPGRARPSTPAERGQGPDIGETARRPEILIVEDDREIARALGIRLRAAGYEIIVAHHGEAGVAAAAEAQPGVIVLDIRLPGMDGLAALAKLRGNEATRQIPVIIHSANVTEKTRGEALELGTDFIFQKPCDTNTLVQAIQFAIAGRRSDGPERLYSSGPPNDCRENRSHRR